MAKKSLEKDETDLPLCLEVSGGHNTTCTLNKITHFGGNKTRLEQTQRNITRERVVKLNRASSAVLFKL